MDTDSVSSLRAQRGNLTRPGARVTDDGLETAEDAESAEEMINYQ